MTLTNLAYVLAFMHQEKEIHTHIDAQYWNSIYDVLHKKFWKVSIESVKLEKGCTERLRCETEPEKLIYTYADAHFLVCSERPEKD